MGNEICTCTKSKKINKYPNTNGNPPKTIKGIKNEYHLANISEINNSEVNDQISPNHVSLTFSSNYSSSSLIKPNTIQTDLEPVDIAEIRQKSQSLLTPRVSHFAKKGGEREKSVLQSDLSSINSNRASFIEVGDEHLSRKLYEAILLNFLIQNFPITNEILQEMLTKNMLLQSDFDNIILSSNSVEKSQIFMKLFVFSENNICRLADFLNVILEEKFQDLLARFQKPITYFASIVDIIYFIINIVSLLVETLDENKPTIFNQFGASINIYLSNNNTFLLSINFYNNILPEQFWPGFSEINSSFNCCSELVLSNCNLSYENIFNIVNGFYLHKTLNKLDLSSNPIGDSSVQNLSKLFTAINNIEYLNLACCSITKNGMESFLDCLSNNMDKCVLKILNISYNDLNDLCEEKLLLINHLKLSKLEMQSTAIKYQNRLFESLKSNYTLRILDISRNKLSANEIKFLASGIAYNFNIKVLVLSMIGVTKSDCMTINNALLMNKSVVSLDLSDNHIGDEGIDILKDLITMKKTLKELYLRRCNISLHGLLGILRKASEANCKLRILDLCYNHSPRLSLAYDLMMLKQKIRELLSDISLMKDLKVLLFGTIDMPHQHLSIRERF